MARIRTIKPEFFTSIQVADLSPTGRLLFVATWVFADDRGVHPWSPKLLKMEAMPGDDITLDQVEQQLNDMDRVGLIRRFTGSDDREYFAITGWRHQKIEKPRYRYPEPPFDDSSATNRRPVGEQSESSRRLVATLTEPNTTEYYTNQEQEHEHRKNNNSDDNDNNNGRSRSKRRIIAYCPDFESWWSAYPKRIGKGKAAEQHKFAVDRIVEVKQLDHLESADWLLGVTKQYAASVAGTEQRYIPHPATWLHQCRYDDDSRKSASRVATPEDLAHYRP